MVEASWGRKRQCGHCKIYFYDLNSEPVICPECDKEYVAPSPDSSRRSSARSTASTAPLSSQVKAEKAVDTVTSSMVDDGSSAPADKGADLDAAALTEGDDVSSTPADKGADLDAAALTEGDGKIEPAPPKAQDDSN